MKDSKFFTVSDFAKVSRTTKDTLLHYDRIGLLSPISRDENNRYRYYSIGQLAVVNVIRTLQALGMSLAEIKALRDQRTPELLGEVYTQLMDRNNAIIDDAVRAQKLLFALRRAIIPYNVNELAFLRS